MRIVSIFNRLLNFEEWVSGSIGLYYLRAMGVICGRKVRLVGWPSVWKTKGSVIRVGHECVFRSRSRHNAIGINHRIILRTQSSEAQIIIGDGVGISGGAICAKKRVSIGKGSIIGSNVVIGDNDFHPIKPKDRRFNRDAEDIPAKEITIGENVWIGADCYVLKGVTIGDNSVIGAMSVVTKSVPPNCVAAGNPAKVLRTIEAE